MNKKKEEGEKLLPVADSHSLRAHMWLGESFCATADWHLLPSLYRNGKWRRRRVPWHSRFQSIKKKEETERERGSPQKEGDKDAPREGIIEKGR